MDITVKNCNNIDEGRINILEGALNIKYAVNGTGKSTISKALQAFIEDDDEQKKKLIPFKYVQAPEDHMPNVSGYEQIHRVAIFNEKYVQDYVYQPTELIKNSFEIFIKSPDYDCHIQEIENLLKAISVTFQNHPELEELIQNFTQFLDGFGKAKSGYSTTGAIGKGIGKGNKITNIPVGLEPYKPYLSSNTNVKWIKWQLDGKTYLDMAEQCPYCSGEVEEKKETILRVAEEYDPKTVEQLNKMLQVFEQLLPYFSADTQSKIQDIMKNVSGISDVQKQYLIEVKQQVEIVLSQLYNLKNMGFHSLKNVEKIGDELERYKIDITYFSHLQSDLTREKVNVINSTLDTVLEKAGRLQGEIAKQKKLVKATIEMYKEEIDDFLHYAGYKYVVDIVEDEGDKVNYRLVLKHLDADQNIQTVEEHLSYGEKNAFALVMFMYNVIKEDPELIILDDPISSFDGNKKFAIINMLFMGKHCLKNKTVLLLTHEFNTVIDVVYNMPYNFNPTPKASFLTSKNGILEEKEIKKDNIKSFCEIAEKNISSNIDTLNKLIYIRRLLDIINPGGLEWQLLSNIFHKRENPEIHDNNMSRLMTEQEIQEATESIRNKYISDFDYKVEYEKTQDKDKLKELYYTSGSNYEKLQIYRIMFNKNSSNSVIKKFVNETFHIENDYLFQLNPLEYDTIPQYIIDECDKEIAES